MNKVAVTSAALVLGFLLVGCSEGSSDTGSSGASESTSSALTPDGVLEDFVTALQPLKSIGETDGDPATEFRQVSDALGPLAGSLSGGIDGVPEDVSYEAAVAAGSLAVSIDLVVDCLSSTPTSCESFISNSVRLAQDTGAAMRDIVPYSNWTVEELTSRL